jgi:hypothetical protein
MILEVPKSPSGLGQVSTSEQYLFRPARPSVVGYTSNARCAHAICRTTNDQAAENRHCSRPSQVRQHVVLNHKCIIVNTLGVSDTTDLKASDMSDSRN